MRTSRRVWMRRERLQDIGLRLLPVRILQLRLVLPPPQLLPANEMNHNFAQSARQTNKQGANALLLSTPMLRKHLDAVLVLELADEARVPELRGDAEVLGAAHEGVALACLRRGWDAVWVEVFLFAACDGNESSELRELSVWA